MYWLQMPGKFSCAILIVVAKRLTGYFQGTTERMHIRVLYLS